MSKNIHQAAAANDIAALEATHQENKKATVYGYEAIYGPGAFDEEGNTPLHLAARNGQIDAMLWLIQHFPKLIEYRDKDGNLFSSYLPSDIHKKKDFQKLVSLVISNKAYSEVDLNGPYTNFKSISKLKNKGFKEKDIPFITPKMILDATSKSTQDKTTDPSTSNSSTTKAASTKKKKLTNPQTIHQAAAEGDVEALERIYQQTPAINIYGIAAFDERGNTPLHLAAQNGHVATMIWLIEHFPKLLGYCNIDNVIFFHLFPVNIFENPENDKLQTFLTLIIELNKQHLQSDPDGPITNFSIIHTLTNTGNISKESLLSLTHGQVNEAISERLKVAQAEEAAKTEMVEGQVSALDKKNSTVFAASISIYEKRNYDALLAQLTTVNGGPHLEARVVAVRLQSQLCQHEKLRIAFTVMSSLLVASHNAVGEVLGPFVSKNTSAAKNNTAHLLDGIGKLVKHSNLPFGGHVSWLLEAYGTVQSKLTFAKWVENFIGFHHP